MATQSGAIVITGAAGAMRMGHCVGGQLMVSTGDEMPEMWNPAVERWR
jgi:hypothetical protein